jgi:hypothetical protein
MAACIDVDQLTETQRNQLVADLHIADTQFVPGRTAGWQSVSQSKAIDFLIKDPDSRKVYIPYWYAGHFTKQPMFNRRRIYHRIQPFGLKDGFELRTYQKDVIDIALQKYRRDGCCFFNVFCAFGKTVTAIWLAYHFAKSNGLLTLITYPGTTVEESWVGTIQEFTHAKVYVVPTGNKVNIPDDVQIIVCSDGRLEKIPQDILDRVGHFVIDEADLFCTQSHVKGLLSVQPLVVTVLTATYERDDGMQKMLDLMVGTDRILRIDEKPFYVIKYETPFTSENYKVGTRGKVWESIAKELSLIPERNLLICHLVLMNMKEKIIVLTYHIEHAVKLHGWITQFLAPYGGIVSRMIESDKTYDDCHVLVGTFSKIGRGFDERQKCRNWGQDPRVGKRRFGVVIIGMSTKKIEQPAGRAGRADEPVIIDIVDCHENTRKHWLHREKWYKARNGYFRTINDPHHASWANMREEMVGLAKKEEFIRKALKEKYKAEHGSYPEPNEIQPDEPEVESSSGSSSSTSSGSSHLKALLSRGLNPTGLGPKPQKSAPIPQMPQTSSTPQMSQPVMIPQMPKQTQIPHISKLDPLPQPIPILQSTMSKPIMFMQMPPIPQRPVRTEMSNIQSSDTKAVLPDSNLQSQPPVQATSSVNSHLKSLMTRGYMPSSK